MTKVAGYIRVSREEQAEGYSLDAQRRAIADYCRGVGLGEPEWYEEPGRSAFTDDRARRPAFVRLLDDVEAGIVGTVVVHKLDRWARNVVVALTELQALERAGGTFVSVNERLDFTTPMGRVVLTILASLAEYYSRNLSAEIRKGLTEKARQGLHVGGLPYGAVRLDGRLAVDPARAADLARLLELAATTSLQRTALALTAEGRRPPRDGARWHDRSIGHVLSHGGWLLGQPAPWPDRWRAAIGRRRGAQVRASGRVRMLSGLLRCACGGRLQYEGGGVYLKCINTARPTLYGCPHRRKRAGHYEALVAAAFLALRLPEMPVIEPDPSAGVAARWAAIQDERRVLGKLLRARSIDEAEYDAGIAQLDAAEATLAPGRRRARELGESIPRAQALWPDLLPEERNAALRAVMEHIVVIGEEVEIVWLGPVREAISKTALGAGALVRTGDDD